MLFVTYAQQRLNSAGLFLSLPLRSKMDLYPSTRLVSCKVITGRPAATGCTVPWTHRQAEVVLLLYVYLGFRERTLAKGGNERESRLALAQSG